MADRAETMLATTTALFSSMMDDLRQTIGLNRDALAAALRKSPNLAYQKVNELAVFTGSRYGVDLQLHFPVAGKISDVDAYGMENVGIVIDKFRRTFPVRREIVKQKAVELPLAELRQLAIPRIGAGSRMTRHAAIPGAMFIFGRHSRTCMLFGKQPQSLKK